ncbi:MAG: hypothetical protein ABEJ03_01840 [Candidatus Nanohaloarchaea archaeon]
MKALALFIIGISTLAGLTLGLNFQAEEVVDTVRKGSDSHGDHSHQAENHSSEEKFIFGSAHRHALFYVSINGSEMDFSSPRYQLAEDYVHLENNNSHVVHSHAKGVKWSDFLETLNMTVRKTNKTCFTANNFSSCGKGTVWLNSVQSTDLNTEIKQGDKLIIAIGENHTEAVEDYRSYQLPDVFEPEARRGRGL